MTTNLMAAIWLTLTIGYNQKIGGESRECTGRGNIQHAAVLRAYRPNGKPWLILCEDLQSWMAFPWEQTRAKLMKTIQQPWWTLGAEPLTDDGVVNYYSAVEIRRGKQ